GRMALALERGVVAALAVTVFAFAAGSSIFYRVLLHARHDRWICLGVLLVLVLAYAAAIRPRQPPPPAALWLAGGLAALALVSTAWSVDAWLSFRRATSLAMVLVIGAGLLHACQRRSEAARRMLLGLLAGIAAVAV